MNNDELTPKQWQSLAEFREEIQEVSLKYLDKFEDAGIEFPPLAVLSELACNIGDTICVIEDIEREMNHNVIDQVKTREILLTLVKDSLNYALKENDGILNSDIPMKKDLH